MVDHLLESLKSFWSARRREIDAKYKRTLPFGDYVVDRWEKAKQLGFGDGASIYDTAHVFGDVKIGAGTWIGPFVILDGSGAELVIGSHCSISAGVQIYTHDTVRWALSGGKDVYEFACTTIGNNTYIGPNVVIAKGVTIGDGCIIGANSLVLSNVPSGAKAHGTPCRIVS